MALGELVLHLLKRVPHPIESILRDTNACIRNGQIAVAVLDFSSESDLATLLEKISQHCRAG